MKRYLIPQMLHEWKSNLWLAIELMVVGGVVCYLSFMLTFMVRGLNEPIGFDPDDVYTLSMSIVNPESPHFIAEDGTDQKAQAVEDMKSLISALRSNHKVEAVALSMNAIPFLMNYQGNEVVIEGMPDSIRFSGNLRTASPDIVRVLRLESLSGLSLEEMEKRMRNGEAFLSPNPFSPNTPEAESLIGKKVNLPLDSIKQYKVGGTVNLIKRSSYERFNPGMILFPFDESNLPFNLWGYDLILRTRPGEGQKFVEEFNNNPSLRKLRNVVLHDLQSLRTRQSLTERNKDIEVRLYVAMLVFFLTIVFLGLLGSFWYRVQQRTGEIALRKVAGAKRTDIFRRLFSEGTSLLLIGFIPGAALFIFFFYKTLYQEMGVWAPWTDAWIGIAVTYVIMQLIILLGILFPATKAMSVEPAIALKDE